MTTPLFQDYEVGQYYRVPCVRVGNTVPSCATRGGWIPILPPFHHDAEILDFPWLHYHYDPRFLTTREYRTFHFGRPLHPHPGQWKNGVFTISPSPRTFFVGSPEYRRKKCQRMMPTFPRAEAVFMPALERAYVTHRMRRGRCPHKGIDLTNCPVIDGIVTCPAHGLRWHVDTGALAPWGKRK